jgi:DNA polymerase I-like protein with 3'-5' exonuclease and polymerase domains
MRIINTSLTNPFTLTGFDRDQVYNGLDVCGTSEILGPMLAQLDDVTTATYEFERDLQGPVCEMGLRGCLVDQQRKSSVIDEFWEQLEILERDLQRIVVEGVGMRDFNWRSTAHLRKLFYEELRLPRIRRRGNVTVDEDAREELEAYPIATQICRHISLMVDLGKKLSVLRTEIDDDGRIRTSYNIPGTSTGRFSSSLSEFGTGGNLQNIEESLRSILVADQGYKFAKFDAKSCQSHIVGAICWNLFRDPRYLDAVESGDIHTAVARLVWPTMGWTGDLKLDRRIADKPFWHHYTHRFMCKKIGHGTNFWGEPPAIALETKLPINIIAEFQPRYLEAFPAIKERFNWTTDEIKTKRYLISLGGRRRYFFGRPSNKKVIKEALAYDPQETESFIVNSAMLKIWHLGIAIIMFQDHDALTFMYPEADEERVLPLLHAALPIPIPLVGGRTLRIPYDCEVGWNKGHYDAERNPDGLREYDGPDNRHRQPTTSIMDRCVHRSDGKPRRTIDLSTLDRDLGVGRHRDTEGMAEDIE